MTTQCRESEMTKARILQAAKKEFVAHGFSGARMSAIAAIADVNQALLHYHFTGKDNLYKVVLRKMFGDFSRIYDERIINEVESWNVTPDLKLCAAVYVFVNSELYFCGDEINRIIAYEIAEGKGGIPEFIKEYLIPQFKSIDKILKEGITSGIFEISNTILFSVNILLLIKNVSHSEMFFRGTELYEVIYTKKYKAFYNFMIEFIFRTLRPTGKKLRLPVLSRYQKDKLNSILSEMKEDSKNY